MKAEPTLFTSAPRLQSGPVWSITFFSSAAMTPYRVGAPMMIASYCTSSSTETSSWYLVASSSLDSCHPGTESITVAGARSSIRRRSTSLNRTERAPSATASAIAAVLPVRL